MIDGEAAMQGTNLLDLPLHRFCSAVVYWAMQRVEKPQEFHAELYAPAEGASARAVSQETVRDEMADFGAFLAATST